MSFHLPFGKPRHENPDALGGSSEVEARRKAVRSFDVLPEDGDYGANLDPVLQEGAMIVLSSCAEFGV